MCLRTLHNTALRRITQIMTQTHTLLVTGGAGFIGSCFVAQRIAAGDRVIVLDALTYAGRMENLRDIPAASGQLVFIKGDITDGTLVRRLLREHAITALINFAAESHVDNSIAESAPFIHTNIIGVHTLLETARDYYNQLPPESQKTFRMVQVSTDEVYGSLGAEGYFTEQSPMLPNSPYSASKAAGDMLARAWFHTYGLPVIVTNCSNNYGPRQFPEKLIPHMIACALSGKPLPVYGDGLNVRDWIHVEDHSRGVMLALEKGIPGETYCFGGRAERTNIDLVRTLCSLLDALSPRNDGAPYASQITFVKDRLGHDRRYAIDDSRAERELGFTRAHDFESGLRDTVQWYLAYTR